MATTVLRLSPCSKNWKPYKIETKDIGIQAYHAILQLGVGYRAMALAARQWRQQGGERDNGGGEGGGVAMAAGRRGERQQHDG
jgi:hypothetical protein